jgi:hypothetical protein
MFNYYFKNAGWALVGILVMCALGTLLIQIQEQWLWTIVDPSPGTRMEDWMAAYERAAWWSLLMAATMSVLWCTYSLIDTNREGDGRAAWAAMYAVCVIAAMGLCYIWFAGSQVGAWAGYAAVTADSIVVFWLSTLFFSPSAHRYAPIGALSLRGRFGLL